MKKMIALLLVFALVISLFTFGAHADTELPLYDKDATPEDIANYFGWSTDKLTADEWDITYSLGALSNEYKDNHQAYIETFGDESSNTVPYTVKRNSQYGMDYYADMVVTTKAYLGITEGSSMGGAGIAAVARAEAEKCANGEPGTFEAPARSNNVKYNTWYYGGEVYGDDYPWCCAFVMWCAEQCGLIESGLFLRTAGCTPLYRYFKYVQGFECYPARDLTTFGGTGYTPVPGDICLFWQGDMKYGDKLMTHIGIVVENEDDVLHVVEGNTTGFGKVPGGGVCENLYTTSMCRGGNWIANATIVHVEYPMVSGAIGVYNFLTGEMGFNDAAALGVMICMDNETSICADRFERKFMQGFGLCGWTDSDYYGFYIWEALRKWCQENGFLWNSYEGQLWYLKHELTESSINDRYTTCYNRLLNAPNTLEGACAAAADFAIYHQGAATYLTGQQYGALMQRRIEQYNIWPDVAGWATNYVTRSDHELSELGLWSGSLFDGTEQWSGQINQAKWSAMGKPGLLTSPATVYN